MRSEPPLVFHPSSFADLPLDLLIDRVDGGLGDDHAFLLTFRGSTTGVELGVAELDEHPVDALLGHRCPPDVDAMGVAVTGNARSVDPAGAADDLPTGRVRVVQVHARDGRGASRLRSIGADPPKVVESRAADGDIADCLRRALELPTPPPTHPPPVWCAYAWLDAVLERAVHDPHSLRSWGQVAKLHPLSGLLPPDRPSSLVALVDETADGIGWSAIRVAAALGEAVLGHTHDLPISAELAEWMDDGMFARWLVALYPDPIDVVADLVDLLPPPVTRGIVEALEAWGCW